MELSYLQCQFQALKTRNALKSCENLPPRSNAAMQPKGNLRCLRASRGRKEGERRGEVVDLLAVGEEEEAA